MSYEMESKSRKMDSYESGSYRKKEEELFNGRRRRSSTLSKESPKRSKPRKKLHDERRRKKEKRESRVNEEFKEVESRKLPKEGTPVKSSQRSHVRMFTK